MSDWIAAAERMPTEEGHYEWRVPSKAVPGEVMVVIAPMRWRGAGYTKVLSPSFDHWDGYRVSIPEDIAWRELPSTDEKRSDVSELVDIEGIENAPCPFCQAIPQWKASRVTRGGYTFNPDPEDLNCFSLSCCDWAKTPEYGNPRELAEQRNAMLSAALRQGD